MKKMFKISIKLLSLVLVALCTLTLVGCDKTPAKNYYDNENDALVFSTLEVDKVFNPFFSTSGTDSNVVGMTQVGMLGNDKNGGYVYGDDEAVITKDLEIKNNGGTQNVDLKTTYYFVLKNNVRFSNGSYLTIKDVLFNLYVYLDPVYSGSSTIYSTDIVGLQAYRTQAGTEKEQEAFKKRFENEASSRILSLIDAKQTIYYDHSEETITMAKFKEYLEEYKESFKGLDSYETYKYLVEDFDKACELFKEELETDYSNSRDQYQDIVFTDDKGTIHRNLLTTDVEVFLYNEGYITWNKKDAQLTNAFGSLEQAKKYTKEQAINLVYQDNMPKNLDLVVTGWATSTTLFEYITNKALETYFASNGERQYKNIEGIKFANKDNPVVVNGKTYDVPQYDATTGVINKDCYEVLSIEINNVDPKAIWNFALSIAPMYYYSDQEHIDKFDFEANFGVEYGSQTFMNEVVKNPEKVGVPVGAGPYAASKASGGLENVKSGDFYDKGVIYFERNPYYFVDEENNDKVGPAIIKKVRFQVVSSAQMLNTLYTGQVDFIEPNAKPETINELNSKKDQGIANKSIQTAGYGYIGINAGKVPSVKVRQAIMHSIDTKLCVDYYKTTAEAIYRPMSKSSWAYPTNATPYYPYIGAEIPENLNVVNPDYADFVVEKGKKAGEKFTQEEQIEFIKRLVEGAKYTLNAQGIYSNGSDTLKYTFTIAGQETDHPAFIAMTKAGELLNKCGFSINVTTDATALSKLASGALTVWAAAWGSTIDPDMYQVYHKDSKATSTLNWGYKQILNPSSTKYEYEKSIVNELSEIIDLARETEDKKRRTELYEQALDLVMQLAVELPTYQRDDLFAYNSFKIDTTTLTPDADLSPFKGLTSDMHLVALNTEE